MFDTLRARLQSLHGAPARARDLAAQRLTERCRKGRVEATAEGLSVQTARPSVSPVWAAIIDGAIAEALKGKP